MSVKALSPSTEFQGSAVSLRVILVLGTWLLLVISLGASGAFIGSPGRPPIVLAIAITTPLLLFLSWLRLSQSFRDFILSLDLRLVASIQAWRWAGLGFLSLYAYKILPAVFAFPAGLGDMAVGFAAPWIVLRLVRQPDFAASPAFIRWNILGIADLVIALTLGTLGAALATGAPGEINTTPMGTLPLLMIPAFLVPLFLMLHATALMQSRQIIARRA